MMQAQTPLLARIFDPAHVDLALGNLQHGKKLICAYNKLLALGRVLTAAIGLASAMHVAAQDKLPIELKSAAKLIQEQSCGDCDIDLAAQLKALDSIDHYLAQNQALGRQRQKEILLLKGQAHFDLAVLHYIRQPELKASNLGQARLIFVQLFKDFPKDALVAEKYLQTAEGDDELIAAYERLNRLNPSNADNQFFAGFYRLTGGKGKFLKPMILGISLQHKPGRIEDYFVSLSEQVKPPKCHANSEKAVAELAPQLRAALVGVEGDADQLNAAMQRFKKNFLAQVKKLQCQQVLKNAN